MLPRLIINIRYTINELPRFSLLRHRMNMIERDFTLIDYFLIIQILARILVIKGHLELRINFILGMLRICK